MGSTQEGGGKRKTNKNSTERKECGRGIDGKRENGQKRIRRRHGGGGGGEKREDENLERKERVKQ